MSNHITETIIFPESHKVQSHFDAQVYETDFKLNMSCNKWTLWLCILLSIFASIWLSCYMWSSGPLTLLTDVDISNIRPSDGHIVDISLALENEVGAIGGQCFKMFYAEFHRQNFIFLYRRKDNYAICKYVAGWIQKLWIVLEQPGQWSVTVY